MLVKMIRRLNVTALLFILISSTLIGTSNGEKIDDWQYVGPQSAKNYQLDNPLLAQDYSQLTGIDAIIWSSVRLIFTVSGLILILLWLAISLDLILRSETGPRKRLGLYLLVGPLLLLPWAFATVLLSHFIPVLSIVLGITAFVLSFVYVIYTARQAMQYNVKKVLVPLIGFPLLGIAFVFITILEAFFGMEITSGGIQESIQYLPAHEPADLGYSTGGAKDIENFRENIKNNYLPLPTDITYEGLFYDYYFDTGQRQRCNELFCPSYSYAISRDPFSEKPEHYLSVGLNSGLNATDFERKKLNLMIVLDISGSMNSSFNQYYYDQFGRKSAVSKEEPEDFDATKMQVATQSIVGLLDHLRPDDNFGMVLYDNQAYIAKPMRQVATTDMAAIKEHILALTPQGGTRMSAGLTTATTLLGEFQNTDQDRYENRIIFLTDAQPNLGNTSKEGLLSQTETNAKNNIHTTFIGIGVDFNTELIEGISKIRGANYYAVHSPDEFKRRMDDEFEYMVTPLVFNLKMRLESDGYRIDKVFGSPEANEAAGEIMKINTLFPSARVAEETRGGLVLLKLTKLRDDATLSLNVEYEDRSGTKFSNKQTVVIDERSPDYYQNNGIRKGILLARYVNIMKNLIIQERVRQSPEPENGIHQDFDNGIPIPDTSSLGQWERQSLPLQVSDRYQHYFGTFLSYFQQEAREIGDESLNRELGVLERLSRNTDQR